MRIVGVIGIGGEVRRDGRGRLLREVGVGLSGIEVIVGRLDGGQGSGERLLGLVWRGKGAIGSSSIDGTQGTASIVGRRLEVASI